MPTATQTSPRSSGWRIIDPPDAVPWHGRLGHGPWYRKHGRDARATRHGTAEIELVLSVVVLITLLTLTIGSMRIALARLDTANSAEFETFRDATSAADPQYEGGGDLPAIEGVGAVRPGLPNRVHVVEPQVDVEVNTGNRQSTTATVGGKAGLPSPAWNYAAYPVGSRDREIYGGWFTGYTDESHGQLSDPLRLAPAWRP